MATVRATVEMGHAARAQVKTKVRQPLPAAVVVADGEEREAIEALGDLVREELNVKDLRFVAQADDLGTHEVMANYRALGPRFGNAMPQVAAAIASQDPAAVTRGLRGGRTVGISIDGAEHELTADDLQLVMQPLEGYQVERAGSHAVALDLHLTDELRREGAAREIVHAIQGARRDAGLDVSDRIRLGLGGDDALLAAAREHERYIAGETLAVEVTCQRRPGRHRGDRRRRAAAHRARAPELVGRPAGLQRAQRGRFISAVKYPYRPFRDHS